MLCQESSCSSTVKGSLPCHIDNNISPTTFPFHSCQRSFISSPYQRPRPGRRRRWQCIATRSSWLACTILMLAIFSVGAHGVRPLIGRKIHGSFVRDGDPMLHLDSTAFSTEVIPSEILFDTRPDPVEELRLHRRQGGDIFESVKPQAVVASTSSSQKALFSNAATAVPSSDISVPSVVGSATRTQSSSSTGSASSSDSSTPSATETGIVMQPGTSPTDLPRVFDGGLGQNYTVPSCPTFLQSMLTNKTFTDCLPFSLLLQVKQSKMSFSETPC